MKITADAIVAFAAFGGFCLSIYNCLLELVRRRPRAAVRVRKIPSGANVDVGFSAAIVNTGIAAFTVTEIYLLKRSGEKVSPPLMPLGTGDHVPKILHPGEQCQIEIDRIGDKDAPVTGDVVRVVFAISSGEEFRSKKLPRGVETGAFIPSPPPPDYLG